MPARRSAVCLLLALALAARAAADLPRVVALSPSITAILLALDAQASLVGVDEVSARVEPRVRALPRVGGLFNPSLEAIVALQPSLVALVPSAQQRDLRERLESLGIGVLALPNISYEDVLNSIAMLGERVGRSAAARARVSAIRAAFREASAQAQGRARVRAVLVLQREPLYVVGRGSFLDAMLDAAGAENLARGFADPYPRASLEWLIAAAPDVILDAADPAAGASAHWGHWPSLPAVAAGRVEALDRAITIPGPYLDRSLAELARRVRGSGSPQ
ncbi:MAG TPA: helical backbone metal receptor [Myxococcota bacterium]|nr:helical backbone metal receptor [Myxococcota bacterium]